MEAIIFAAAEPLDVETIQNKITKKIDVEKESDQLSNFCLKKDISFDLNFFVNRFNFLFQI